MNSSETCASCAACGHARPDGNRFCGGCGAALGVAAPRSGAAPAPDPRTCIPKQVAVLFADVKGSMELGEQLDPQEWHRVLERVATELAPSRRSE